MLASGLSRKAAIATQVIADLSLRDYSSAQRSSPQDWLTSIAFTLKLPSFAEVAELADALRSGRSECKLVWVRLPPSAPKTKTGAWAPVLFGKSQLFAFLPCTRCLHWFSLYTWFWVYRAQ